MTLGYLGLFRTMGPGLGNLLFPIARALIGAELEGQKMMNPIISALTQKHMLVLEIIFMTSQAMKNS